ncbi:unnamed protein product [Adineta steineri]|uniref:F-box domain-containing protein n=1 Tax=Adineta steineri TaxID=433720 RepID=A0A816CKP3_9BILA|nr:unnamed protein product [Adineta steineri]CAF1431696.1 unnamed protein product [Adineta steineri]CAF1624606.1 unnamed protein product [Adineta steineri]CAF1624644.1 unnamed protein product [Adineta steineri]
MNFNLLPNEILLTFFDYLDGDDLLHAFDGLNARINALLYKQYRRYYFDFSVLSKRSFDLICQQYIPLIADHILALHLSDSESTPGQISLFFSYIPSLRQFTHLRSLSFTYLRSKDILLNVAIELPYLVQLTHLKFNTCSIPDYDETDFELLMNNIWNLPNLIHFYLYIHKEREQLFIIPSKISPSLKYLSINTEKLNWNLINRLFQHTPNLKYLRAHIDCSKNGDGYIGSSFSTLTSLNIFIAGSHSSKIIPFLQDTRNLHHLNIRIAGPNFIDGYQWEDLIRNYLPKLKTFHFSMTDLHFIRLMTKAEIDELMNSFRSSFWIDEHQWFVRCIGDRYYIRFEAVSKAFRYAADTLPSVFKSTDSQDNIERLYTPMSSISDETLFDRPISSKICFPKLNSLSVKCPINDQYWSMVSNLQQVSSLSLHLSTDLSQSELQALLNRMPHLRLLTIHQDASLPLPMSLFDCTFPSSIHYLDLEYCKHYFNEEDCIILTHSSLTSQIKQLDILVKNRESITILVKNMPNLSTLCARFTDEIIFESRPSRIRNNVDDEIILCKDEDIQWLVTHLPSTCAISRHPFCVNHLRIWIK